ncbi:carbamoyltransferase N-terminal domain-containing protein, partial [Noviherbaspirillum denitrificans]|uniref:carbamoyltransferase N-terminal domain-containing protein n=1 Tax=Noviherbaspirillum denitrificans TaxID=1968433 RepID=UPI002351DA5B
MSQAPRILGVNRTQDASICLMEGSRLVFAIQKERLTRQKHHWGKVGDFRDVYLRQLAALNGRIDVLVECYSSDSEIDRLDDYE